MSDARRPGRELTARHRLRSLLELVKWVAEPERLPQPPPHRDPGVSLPGISAWLERGEPLPMSPTVIPSGTGFFAWLISSDSLPPPGADPERAARSFLSWLVSRDRLDRSSADHVDKGGLVS